MPPQHPPGSEGSRRDGCGTRGQNRCQGTESVPGGGGRAWPGFEIDHSEPQARVWRSRGRAAAHGHLDKTTWTPTCPARGPPIPHAGRLSRTWAGLPRLGTAGPRADEKAAPRHAKHAKHEPQQHDTSYNPTCGPTRLEGTTGPVGPAGPCRASDRPLRAAGSRRAYCRSDSSRFARTTMPMRSTIASSTQLPSSAARRGCIGASSKRRSKPRIARHRGMSSSW